MQILTSIHFSDHRYFCIQSHCVQTHILSVLSPSRGLTLRTNFPKVYIQFFTYIWNISYDGRFCTRIHGAETHICLCPCERSQLEPLCVHANTHKYAFLRSQMLLYISPLCATSHMSVPLRALTVRTSLFTCKYSQVYIFQITDTFVYKAIVCKLTFCLCSRPREGSHFEPIFQKYIYNSLHIFEIYRMMDAFVQESTVRKLTYVYALASAHS